MAPDPNGLVDLDISVGTAVDQFIEEFRQLWELDGNAPPEGLEWERWCELLSLDAAAQHLVAASIRLYRPEGLQSREVNWPAQLAAAAEAERSSHEEILARIKELGHPEQDWPTLEAYLRPRLPDPDSFRERFFRASLQNYLADAFIPSLHALSGRLVKLVGYLTREGDPRIGAYLERVARCYLLDMVPELALMSRAVVEAALEKRLPAEYMRKVRGISSNRRVPLDAWIDEAEADGLLSQRAGAAARRLRDHGSAVAHGEPLLDADADSILADLHAVVAALDQRSV